MRTDTGEMAAGAAAGAVCELDASGVPYRELNARLRNAVLGGARSIAIRNVQGQRYIGTNLGQPVEVEVCGAPGDDLGAFMEGPRLVVRGDVPDGCGNALRGGEIIVHGRAGDILGMSARGGRIFVRDDAGCRAGIDMSESGARRPVVVIGGTAGDFLAQYMGGGVLVLLGLTLAKGKPHASGSIGTGMHGGVIYVRGGVDDSCLARGVARTALDENDRRELRRHVSDFTGHFGGDVEAIMEGEFARICPVRPGGPGRPRAA